MDLGSNFVKVDGRRDATSGKMKLRNCQLTIYLIRKLLEKVKAIVIKNTKKKKKKERSPPLRQNPVTGMLL